MKTSTFDTKLMNNRKIRILTTIDPFWDISVYLPNVLAKDQARYFFKTFPTENEDIYGKKYYVSNFKKDNH